MDGRRDDGIPIIGYGSQYGGDDEDGKLWLGHSCDHWVLGTPDEARAIIALIQQAIERAEAEPGTPFDNEN